MIRWSGRRQWRRWFGDADARDALDASDYGPHGAPAGTPRFLTDLADVLYRAGCVVVEYEGWQERSRSSGGYASGEPHVIVVHHTASGASADGEDDAWYIAEGSDISPIANLYLDRSGTWWVLAAGACNHAGSGGPKGDVPLDSANTRSIGIEAGNNGVGEPWPKVQTDSYVRGVRALSDHYGIHVGNVWSHAEWAEERKIDPAGPSPWATGSNTWDEDAFRGSVALFSPTPADDGVVYQGEAYDTLTLWFTVNYPDLVGVVAPSVDQGGQLRTQGDLYDTIALWFAVNPGIDSAIRNE